MGAIEESKALLDKRGVEYELDAHGMPQWRVDGSTAYVHEMGVGLGCALTIYPIAPERAIEATLGLEPDDEAMVKLHDRMNAALLEYERAQGIKKRDRDGEVVVPFVAEMHSLLEEAAALGRGECHNESKATEFFFYCSECGCAHLRNRAYVDVPRFCPNCGRKVVGNDRA